jgi:hypothetical protein
VSRLQAPLVFLIISLTAEYAGNVEEMWKLPLPAGWHGPKRDREPIAIVQLHPERKRPSEEDLL